MVFFTRKNSHVNRGERGPSRLLGTVRTSRRGQGGKRLGVFFKCTTNMNGACTVLRTTRVTGRRKVSIMTNCVRPRTHPGATTLLGNLRILPAERILCGNVVLGRFSVSVTLGEGPRLVLISRLTRAGTRKYHRTGQCRSVGRLLGTKVSICAAIGIRRVRDLYSAISSVARVIMRRHVPSSLFSGTSRIRLVSVRPRSLVSHLGAKGMCERARTGRIMRGFFAVRGLATLQRVTLQQYTSEIGVLARGTHVGGRKSCRASRRVLIYLSSSPSGTGVVHATTEVTSTFGKGFATLFMRAPSFSIVDRRGVGHLHSGIHLTRRLKTGVRAICKRSVPFRVTRFTHLSNTSGVIVKQDSTAGQRLLDGPALARGLVSCTPGLSIRVVPSAISGTTICRLEKNEGGGRVIFSTASALGSATVLVLSDLIKVVFRGLKFNRTGVVAIFILNILIATIVAGRRMCDLVSSVMDILVFGFLFARPRFALRTCSRNCPIAFVVVFLTTFLANSLTVQVGGRTGRTTRSTCHAGILFSADRLLRRTGSGGRVMSAASGRLVGLLKGSVIFCLTSNRILSAPRVFSMARRGLRSYVSRGRGTITN